MASLLPYLLPLLGFTGGSAALPWLLRLLAGSGGGTLARLAGGKLVQGAAPLVGGLLGQMGVDALGNSLDQRQTNMPTNDTEMAALAQRPEIRQNQLMELLLQQQGGNYAS